MNTRHTTHKAVLPFYVYAALAFLAGAVLLTLSDNAFLKHYFHPNTLAITHTIALGWGTMIILGASHQLVPVLIEGTLYNNRLAHISFTLAALGIPLLVYAFYVFDMGWPARTGAIMINAAILVYIVNLFVSLSKSKHENVQVIFVFTAALWLLFTTILGLLMVYNFSFSLFSKDSLRYLPLHAHLGIAGWFLLLIIGVASRLIPMFLISKYENTPLLWWLYGLINGGLLLFTALFIYFPKPAIYMAPLALVMIALLLFGYYIFQSFRSRIRRKVDPPMQISLLSVLMTLLPLLLLLVILVKNDQKLVLTYGFTIFFGWITAIILGMTFKTLPFIIWNKVYHGRAGLGKTPDPKDLFDHKLFGVMAVAYITGFVLFGSGILLANPVILKLSALLLLVTAVFYNLNVFKVVYHHERHNE
jgi:hypothetical protein